MMEVISFIFLAVILTASVIAIAVSIKDSDKDSK